MSASLITSEVDFEAEGRQTGFLRVPHSVTRSAYGWIGVPVTVLKNGAGPTVLLMAGNHGDEFEGQVALSRLAGELTPEDVTGRLIILPMVNFPAAEAGLRVSPVDGGNLNRAFPGDPQGTPTQMIAHFVETVLMPLCDYAVDLHSGGASLFYQPTLLRGKGATPDEAEKLDALQDAFDLPWAWIFTSGGGRSSTARTAMGAANRNGVICVMAELGGGGEVTPSILADTERGLRRAMHSLGLLRQHRLDKPRGTRAVHAQGSVYAYDAGILELLCDIGDPVQEGDTVGLIHHPDAPDRAPTTLASKWDGVILARRALGRVERGDAVVQVARDAKL